MSRGSVTGVWVPTSCFYPTTRFNITTGGNDEEVTLNVIKLRYEKHGQSELAWYYLMKIISLSENLIELFVTLR
jgi:hypothetical protein